MTILIVGDAIHHLFVIQNQLGILKQQHIKIKLLKKTKRLIGILTMLEQNVLQTGLKI